MKEYIKKMLRYVFGIKVIKLNSVRSLPVPTIDNIEVVVKFYSLTKKKITLLQIGACDGETSDSINKYIKAGDINAFLVEPSVLNFTKLEKYYQQRPPNVTLINAAIGIKDGKQSFYSIKDQGRWKDNGWARQLASFYREHLVKHGILDSEIHEEQVDCFTMQSLVSKYNIGMLDVLVIDTEGFDGEIVKMTLTQDIRPIFIAFENVQLVKNYKQKDLVELYKLIEQSGYCWTHDRINTMAVRKDFLNAKFV
jgi:FkbM family methyltransferase